MRVYRLIAKTTPSQPATGSTDTKKSRPRVLIVDDDPDLVAIVAATLRPFEMDCDVASNGEQAVDAVHRCPPDAIILDVNMFDLDGFEVLKRLRRNLITKEIPVLPLTARVRRVTSPEDSDPERTITWSNLQTIESCWRVDISVSPQSWPPR